MTLQLYTTWTWPDGSIGRDADIQSEDPGFESLSGQNITLMIPDQQSTK